MGAVTVTGAKQLCGEVRIQGSKNSVLPIIAASLLCKDITTIYNCPQISDVYDMLRILTDLGCDSKWYGHTLVIDTRSVLSCCLEEAYTRKIRASVLFLGALLGRCQEAYMGYPGGCNIGKRPIDLHAYAFEKLGAELTMEEMGICCKAVQLEGALITYCFPSVGATENAMLAAVLAKGRTRIHNAAREPEITDLADFLNRMGARITGAGTITIEIEGVECLNGISYYLPYDRIVAGTYLMAGVGTRSRFALRGLDETVRMSNIIRIARDMGCDISAIEDGIAVDGRKRPGGMHIVTGPYPGVPTDMQPLFLAVLTTASGRSQIVEQIFEGRLKTAEELKKMGAQILVDECTATIMSVSCLTGAVVEAADLRGGAALILGGLMANGTSIIKHTEYVERGYENLVQDLSGLGADIAYL